MPQSRSTAKPLARTFTFVVLLFAASAVVAEAQIPGGFGGMGRRRGVGRPGESPNGQAAAMPTSADLTKDDPILVLLGNRASLSLADSQVAQLVRLDAELVERNRPLLAEVDSLNAAAPARDSSGGRAGGSESLDRRRAFANVLHQIRANERASVDQALALLGDDQRAKAEKLLQAEREKSEKRNSRLPRGLSAPAP